MPLTAPPEITDYRILYDNQANGYRSSSGSALLRDGELAMPLMYASDGARGLPQHIVYSRDLGRTWTDPAPFGPPLSDPENQHQGVNLTAYTPRGTLICSGYFMAKGIREDGDQKHYEEDVAWRPCEALIGRREAGQRDITWTRFPSGTFTGEQFVERGLVTRSGRLVVTIWGSAKKGENWQCGVLLSDDDGKTWRHRVVGFEPDHAIRAKPNMPAGFNEQSLFELPDGRLVSIIRGREKLGAFDDKLDESYFFRSESRDGGETWSPPEVTNLAGTGAALPGLTLPDGSLLHAARIPLRAASLGMKLPEPELYGLLLSRSTDAGRTWRTEHVLQRDPTGKPFDYYYNAMNGHWVKLAEDRWLYTFGHFDYLHQRDVMLSLELSWKG